MMGWSKKLTEGSLLEQQGLIERGMENAWLAMQIEEPVKTPP
jgi:hypothetical protein